MQSPPASKSLNIFPPIAAIKWNCRYPDMLFNYWHIFAKNQNLKICVIININASIPCETVGNKRCEKPRGWLRPKYMCVVISTTKKVFKIFISMLKKNLVLYNLLCVLCLKFVVMVINNFLFNDYLLEKYINAFFSLWSCILSPSTFVSM